MLEVVARDRCPCESTAGEKGMLCSPSAYCIGVKYLLEYSLDVNSESDVIGVSHPLRAPSL